MKLKILTSILSIFIIVSWQNNPTKHKNNDNPLSNSLSPKTDDNDYFLGNWYNCNTAEWECFIKLDGENYGLKNKSGEQSLTKKNATLLEGSGGLFTIKFDKSSNHLLLNDNGTLKEFCKAHGNNADANDKTSRENGVDYSDRIGERPSNTKIGKIEVMNKDLDNGGGYNWNQAKAAAAALGKGWRLPTKEELHTLYLNRVKIGGFSRQSYWSSTEENIVHVYKDAANKEHTYRAAWDVPFGHQNDFIKEGFSNEENFEFVRLVRTN